MSVPDDDMPKVCDTCKVDVTESWMIQSFKLDGTLIRTLCASCDDAKRIAKYLTDRVLNTRLIEKASMEHAFPDTPRCDNPLPVAVRDEIVASAARIQDEIGRFETEVWFGGMQAFARASAWKGTAFKAGKISVMCFTMCARAMLTIESETGSVTTITEERAPPRSAAEFARYKRGMMGLRGIDATEACALSLLRTARGAWLAREALGYAMVEDSSVTLGVPGMGGTS